MSIPGLDEAKCERRNRLAARKGVNSVPVRFLSAPPGYENITLRAGNLPTESDQIMAHINASQPDGAIPLTADDVWVHYVEAANNNYVRKYNFFLSDRTLKNFAIDAESGVAFMNSHRTGDMSTPSELPFGTSFGGEFVKLADGSAASYLGFYMLKGIMPNGSSGPSTDDLHKMISAGTIPGVSVGIPPGGQELCDICKNPLEARGDKGERLCTHAPGTTSNLTPAERKAQEKRGVPGGVATFTLDDAHLSEVSAVYKGAVPGAGFRKVLMLARERRLSATDLVQARSAYAALLTEGDGLMDELGEVLEGAVERGVLRAQDGKTTQLTISNGGSGHQEADTVKLDAQAAELALLKSEIAREREARLELEAVHRREKAQLRAQSTVDDAIRNGKLYPAERVSLLAFSAAIYELSAAHADLVMLAADGATVTLAQGLDAVLSARPQHGLLGENIPSNARVSLVSADPRPEADETREARKKYLLSRSAVGQRSLTLQKEGGK